LAASSGHKIRNQNCYNRIDKGIILVNPSQQSPQPNSVAGQPRPTMRPLPTITPEMEAKHQQSNTVYMDHYRLFGSGGYGWLVVVRS
jgi:hypothetical protein